VSTGEGDRQAAPSRRGGLSGLHPHLPRHGGGARALEGLRTAWGWVDSQFGRWRQPALPIVPFEPGVTKLGWSLARPALMGFVATTAIFLGATQQNSPFTSKIAGSWYWGIPPPAVVQGYTPAPGQWLFLGVVAVYGGMALLLRAWWDIIKLTSGRPGIPVARLWPVFAAWVLPLLLVAPLFSKDVYSYAAQGEMMSHGLNPYQYGTGVLGATPFTRLVDHLWINNTSPYGPLFLVIDGWIVVIAHHNLLLSVVGLRFLALAGVVLFAVAIPSIARSFHRDPAVAFVLAALNPLVLLHLIAGAHNDALMLGFLAVGYALARRGRPVVGIVACGLAAAVKIPALLGAVYIGWEWLGTGRSVRERVRPVATALLIALATMICISEAASLGWGWIGGLTNPDTVRSWLDPATGVALVVAHLVTALGFGNHVHVILTVVRGSAACLAGLIGLWLLLHSERIGSLQALGWSLFAVVVLGPVVQLWYLSWAFVFLAPIAVGLARKVLIGVSGIACFLGLTGGRVFINEISSANSVLVAFACATLVGIGVFLLRPKHPRSRPAPRELVRSP
jgi:alpha-1,6-mannosyltransferase